MKRITRNVLWLAAFLGIGSIGLVAEPFAKGPYLGQTRPGPTPQVFAPRLICRPGALWESDGTFSIDGKVFSHRQGLMAQLWTVRISAGRGDNVVSTKVSRAYQE